MCLSSAGRAERPAHNRSVAGSNPAGPTKTISLEMKSPGEALGLDRGSLHTSGLEVSARDGWQPRHDDRFVPVASSSRRVEHHAPCESASPHIAFLGREVLALFGCCYTVRESPRKHRALNTRSNPHVPRSLDRSLMRRCLTVAVTKYFGCHTEALPDQDPAILEKFAHCESSGVAAMIGKLPTTGSKTIFSGKTTEVDS